MTDALQDRTSSAFSTPSSVEASRRLPIGAEVISDTETHFRVWAPTVARVEVVINEGRAVALEAEGDGYFSGAAHALAGDRYSFRLGDHTHLYPDPASRFQPNGPHAASQIVDPRKFAWHDQDWDGVALGGQILYELHAGTFTRDGTWRAAARELPALADLGITTVELMPIAEFEGRFGWGYDGVDLFAPFHRYGTPDDLRGFIDLAHTVGIGVVLDVVYNHLGPVGNYLRPFSPSYFTDKYKNEWGDAMNFDGSDAGPVREFFLANAEYWIDEFHFDGLRLDATQQIFDNSPEHIVAAVGRRVREAAGRRSTIVVAENEPQDSLFVRAASDQGYGLDALWNDDFHHSAMVALTGRAEAYYSDTRGEPQEFISAAKYGYLFQGQHYAWQHHPRGVPSLDIPPARFVVYLQNHDQVANSATGERGHLLTSPARWRAMTAVLLLLPGTPMLFQGQEFSASSPFLYFADMGDDLADAIRQGRAEFLGQFPSIVEYMSKKPVDLPHSAETFERCILNFEERTAHAHAYALHRDLIHLRRNTDAFRRQARHAVDGAILSSDAFALRFFGEALDGTTDRLLIVNLGRDLPRPSFAEPLLAPPVNRDWAVQWSSENPLYGGRGTPNLWPNAAWHIPGETAHVLAPSVKRPLTHARIPRRTA